MHIQLLNCKDMLDSIDKKEEETMTIDELKEFREYDTIEINPSIASKENQQEKEQKNEKYQIVIDFYSNNTSIEWKRTVINMVDRLNVNHKVEMIAISMKEDNPIDREIIRRMDQKYKNIYGLGIHDYWKN